MVVAATDIFTLTLPAGTDLTQASHIVFSIVQDCFELHKKDTGIEVDSTDHNKLTVSLTQEDTLNFSWNEKAEIQLNIYYSNGSRVPTKVYEIEVEKNLYREVIS